MKSSRRGMALPLALLAMLTLTLLAHGLLLLSQREVQAAAALRDLAVAEKAAMVGLRVGWATPRGPGLPTSPKDWISEAAGTLPGRSQFEVSRLWLDSEFFLLKGTGRTPGRAGSRHLVWLGREGACVVPSETNLP